MSLRSLILGAPLGLLLWAVIGGVGWFLIRLAEGLS
jgi:hypothetical protein